MIFSMKRTILLAFFLFLAQSSSGKCYYSACGCPGNFQADWCGENSYSSGWCSQSASNCGTCSGAWCPTNSQTTTSTAAPATTTSTAAPVTTTSTAAPVTTTSTAAPTSTSSSGNNVPNPQFAVANMKSLFDAQNKQSGDQTFYGSPSGGCNNFNSALGQALPKVAIGVEQHYLGYSCGMCVQFDTWVEGSGTGPIEAAGQTYLVVDRCSSCQPGDLDLAKNGDGRHDITWHAVPCPVNSEPIQYIHAASHTHWMKIQPQHTRYPAKNFYIKQGNDKIALIRTVDGHFTTEGVSGLNKPFSFPLAIQMCDIYDHCIDDFIVNLSDGPGLNQQQFASN